MHPSLYFFALCTARISALLPSTTAVNSALRTEYKFFLNALAISFRCAHLRVMLLIDYLLSVQRIYFYLF